MPRRVDMNDVNSKLSKRGVTMCGPYRGMNQKTVFACAKSHFWSATTGNVYHKGKGCPHCSGNARRSVEVINQRLKQDGNSLRIVGEYINNSTKSPFECQKCGRRDCISPASALSGHGCAGCAGNARLSVDQLQRDFKSLGYQIVGRFINARTPVAIVCEKGHEWDASPDNVRRGTGCPTCAIYGYDPNFPAILYYVRILLPGMPILYKIGITKNEVSERFSRSQRPYVKVLRTKRFSTGRQARAKELTLLARFSEYRYDGADVLERGGDTELFDVDVLSLNQTCVDPFL